jgi:O-antigen/teichoic acid export membrane protein
VTTSRETVRQIRGSGLLLAGRVLSLVLNLVVQIATVRVLSKEGYGLFAYAISVAAVAEGIVGLGLPRAVARFLPMYEEEEDRPRMLGTILLALAGTAACGAAAVLFIVGFRGVLAGELAYDPAAVASIAILSALAPLQAFDRLLMEIFSVFGQPRAIFVRRFVLGPVLRLGAVLLLAARGGGPELLAIGYVAAGAIGLAFSGAVLFQMLRERRVLRPGALREMKVPAAEIFAFALPLLSTEIVFVGIQQVDAVLLGQMTGPEAIASLRAVAPIARLNQVVLDIFGILFTPLAARLFQRGDHAGVNKLYWSTTVWIAVLSFPVFAVTFCLARPLAALLFGAQYAESGEILAILSFAYYVHAALGPNGLALNVYKLVRYVVAVNVVAFLLHVAVNLMLIPAMGAKGAALATAATLLVHNGLKQWGLRRTGGVRAFDPARARPLLVVGGTVAAIVAAEVLWSPPLLVAAAIAVAASAFVLLQTRRALDVATTFPEVLRVPGVARLLGRPGDIT